MAALSVALKRKSIMDALKDLSEHYLTPLLLLILGIVAGQWWREHRAEIKERREMQLKRDAAFDNMIVIVNNVNESIQAQIQINTAMQKDLTSVKSDINSIKSDLISFKTDVHRNHEELSGKISENSNRISHLEIHLPKHNSQK